MLNVCIRPQPAVAGVPAIAATAGETSSDEILVERIAAGDRLAMQALFVRHRTPGLPLAASVRQQRDACRGPIESCLLPREVGR